MLEEALQDGVARAAQSFGYRVAHVRPARRKGDPSWSDQLLYDSTGFPDLVMAHPNAGIVAIECKSDSGRVSPQQTTWIDTLNAAGTTALVCRPGDFHDTVTLLEDLAQAPTQLEWVGDGA